MSSDVPWTLQKLPVDTYGQLPTWGVRRIAAAVDAAKSGTLEGIAFGGQKGADYIKPTPTTLAVYAALCLYTDYGGEGGAYPSQKTLGTVAGVSRETAARHLLLLRALGVVDWDGKASALGTNSYTVPLEPRPPVDIRFAPLETRKDFDAYPEDVLRESLLPDFSERSRDNLDGWESDFDGDPEPVADEPAGGESTAAGGQW